MIPRRRRSDRYGWVVAVAVGSVLTFAAAVSMAGCAGGKVWARCELSSLPSTEQALIAAVASIATSPSGYIDALIALGKSIGPDQVDCVAVAIAADSRTQAATKAHLQEYLGARKAAGAHLACR